MRVPTHRLNKTICFGDVEPGESINPNTAEPILEFKSIFSVHGGIYSRNQSQKIAISGTDLQNTIVILVRHNKKINNKMKLQIEGVIYQIVDISIDDSMPISYDLITVRENVIKRD